MNVIRLFRQYKREQTEILEAEKAEIAAERKQTEEMLRELQALKEQLANQAAISKENTGTTSDTEENSSEND